jgi:hypothetical protein
VDDAFSQYGQLALRAAALNCDVEMLRYLVSEGGDLNDDEWVTLS